MRIPITVALAGVALAAVPATASTPAPKVTSVKSLQYLSDLPSPYSGSGIRLLANITDTTSSKNVTVSVKGVHATAKTDAGGGYGVPTLVAVINGSRYSGGHFHTNHTYTVKIKMCSSGGSCSNLTKKVKLTKG